MVNDMKKRIFTILLSIISLFFIAACGNNSDNGNNGDDNAYAYCSQFYSAAFGNYGSFEIELLDDSEFESVFDISKITLSGAFSGMEIASVYLVENSDAVAFNISGNLNEGDYGIVSGEGIVKGKSTEIFIPITQAYANSESKIYANTEEQTIKIDLVSACFNATLVPEDFILDGAAKNMTIKSVTSDYTVDDDGEIILAQTATLTLTGDPSGTDYAYIDVKSSATTFNKTVRAVLNTDYYGAYIANDFIDSFSLSDTIYIKANNVVFAENVSKDDLTLGGALENYAIIESVEVVDESLLALHLSFPYTFVNYQECIGYIEFSANTNLERKVFTCSAILSSPEIDFVFSKNETSVTIELTLQNEVFNLLATPKVKDKDGNEISLSGVEIIDIDNYVSITFDIPENYSGTITCEIENAYDIVLSDSTKENVMVKASFYI